MKREYHKRFSDALDREMEMLVFGHAGARVVTFPTRDGRFYDYENWRIVETLRDKIEDGYLQLFCLDSVDGEALYAAHKTPEERLLRHLDYETYVLYELLPFSETLNENPFVITFGCSFGAFHAMNIALKNPVVFDKVVALSGRYDLTLPIGSFRDLFDGFYDDEVYYNTPSHYIPRLADPELLADIKKLDISFAVGEHDAFLQNNREFSEALWSKGIWHHFSVWHGEAHRSRYWRQMAKLYL